jgi:hypothetical protein
MNDSDQILTHNDYVRRLRLIQDGKNTLDHISDLYDQLADADVEDRQILESMRPALQAATEQAIPVATLYKTLTHRGLALSLSRFVQLLSTPPVTPQESVSFKGSPPDGNGPSLSADEWALVFATSIGPEALGQKTIRRRLCAALQAWGIKLPEASLRNAALDLQAAPRATPIPPWSRVLDQVATPLLGMLSTGCDVTDIAAALARRCLPAPESEIAVWLKTAHTGAREANRRATLVRHFEDKYDDLGGHRLTMSVDRADAHPFRVTVLCATPADVAFAQTWLDAGLLAIGYDPSRSSS